MAKRKRLTPPQVHHLADGPEAPGMASAKSAPRGPAIAPPIAPPIAHVAGEAASASALSELSDMLAAARAEGRLLLPIPLDVIETHYLERDRLLDPTDDDMQSLKQSLRSRGQQTPVELTKLPHADRYGLISGLRRITALGQLFAETGEARFATVLARIVQPAEAADAYVAMVEENEIRAGLSYYERARTVVRSLEAGAFSSEREALQTLYAAASRPRRSKIGSFITLVRALDTDLSWPTHIPERLGLELSRRLTAEPAFAETIKAALSPQAMAPAEELLRLEACLAAPQSEGTGHSKPAPAAASKSPPSPAPKPTHPTADVQLSSELEQGRIVLSGSGVTAAFAQRLETWLKGQHG